MECWPGGFTLSGEVVVAYPGPGPEAELSRRLWFERRLSRDALTSWAVQSDCGFGNGRRAP
jgi:hypothetical protein